MNTPPDFYLYRGDGNQAVLVTLRACRKLRAIEHGGRTVILVGVEPPIPSGVLPKGSAQA